VSADEGNLVNSSTKLALEIHSLKRLSKKIGNDKKEFINSTTLHLNIQHIVEKYDQLFHWFN